MSEEHLSNSQ
jgi:hypothetical protein